MDGEKVRLYRCNDNNCNNQSVMVKLLHVLIFLMICFVIFIIYCKILDKNILDRWASCSCSAHAGKE